MPSTTSYPVYTAGQWVQLCEYRPGRRSLYIDVQNVSMILGFSTNGPQTQSPIGISPPGLLISPNTGNGRPIFHLCRECVGDLVEQAWSGWGVPASQLPLTPVVQVITTSTTWTVPAGTTQVAIEADGAGGSSQPATALAGPSGGGGGGAVALNPSFAVTPGQTLTTQCAPSVIGAAGAVPVATWISNTGIAPVSNATGVMGASGTNGPVAGSVVPTPGGTGAGSQGITVYNGNNGGAIDGLWFLGSGSSGGGGGGGGVSTGSTFGGPGQAGSKPASAGGNFGGGNGGASDGSVSTTGIMGTNSGGSGGSGITPAAVLGAGTASRGGRITITYQPLIGNVITVIESFDTPALTNAPGYINPYAPPPLILPPLTKQVQWQLQKFWSKICGGK